ncbi:MAG: hypothetical protein AABY26_02980 [Nanoarchaeota archaeon]
MRKTLEELAQESTILQLVLEGKTTYPQEAEKYFKVYSPGTLGRLGYLFKSVPFDKQHFECLVTDLNNLSEHYWLFGEEALPRLRKIEKTPPEKISPAKRFTSNHYSTAGVIALFSSTFTFVTGGNASSPIGESVAAMLIGGALSFGLMLAGTYALDRSAHPNYQYLRYWAGSVQMCLKKTLELNTNHRPHGT